MLYQADGRPYDGKTVDSMTAYLVEQGIPAGEARSTAVRCQERKARRDAGEPWRKPFAWSAR